MQEEDYIYTRSKDVFKNGNEKLFLFAGLSKREYRREGEELVSRFVPLDGTYIRELVEKADPDFLALPDKTIEIPITYEEYLRLETLRIEEKKEFFLYQGK